MCRAQHGATSRQLRKETSLPRTLLASAGRTTIDLPGSYDEARCSQTVTAIECLCNSDEPFPILQRPSEVSVVGGLPSLGLSSDGAPLKAVGIPLGATGKRPGSHFEGAAGPSPALAAKPEGRERGEPISPPWFSYVLVWRFRRAEAHDAIVPTPLSDVEQAMGSAPWPGFGRRSVRNLNGGHLAGP